MALGDFTYELTDVSNIRFRDELQLAIDRFGKPQVRQNLEALAQVIQNLIIFEPGTFPNDPELGVGIANYIFELADNKTYDEIQNRINDQVTMYIPHQYVVVNTIVNPANVKKNDIVKSLIIKITISDVDDPRNNVEIMNVLATSKVTNRLVSELYVN